MGKEEVKNSRRLEVGCGLILVLLAFSYIASLLLDFQFISPYASLQEDLQYLGEHAENFKTGTIAWMVTSLLTFMTMPFLFLLFRREQAFIAYANLILMTAASIFFFLMALNGFRLYHSTLELVRVGVEGADEAMKLSLLDQFNAEKMYRLLGSSMVGLWSFTLSFARYRQKAFPLAASLFLIAGAPVLIFFNWYDMDHLLRTIAMAAIIIGVLLLCARLINRGFAAGPKA